MTTTYWARRLQASLDSAQRSTDVSARLAHEGLASLYRAKLLKLGGSAEIVDLAPPRVPLKAEA